MFKIEKNVPVPSGSGIGRPSKYPFNAMEVGESFSFPNEIFKRVSSAASMASSASGKKFKVSGVHNRCWRVE